MTPWPAGSSWQQALAGGCSWLPTSPGARRLGTWRRRSWLSSGLGCGYESSRCWAPQISLHSHLTNQTCLKLSGNMAIKLQVTWLLLAKWHGLTECERGSLWFESRFQCRSACDYAYALFLSILFMQWQDNLKKWLVLWMISNGQMVPNKNHTSSTKNWKQYLYFLA